MGLRCKYTKIARSPRRNNRFWVDLRTVVFFGELSGEMVKIKDMRRKLISYHNKVERGANHEDEDRY